MSQPDSSGSVRDRRRHQILREARALVAEQGVAGLTIGALEKRLPFTRGVITYHFRDKHEIVHAVLDDAIRDIHHGTLAGVGKHDTAADRVRAAIRAVVTGYLTNVEAGMVLLSFWGRIASEPQIAAKNAEVYQRYRAQAAVLVEQGVATGEFRADADPALVAGLMVGSTIGIATQAYFQAGAIDIERSIDGASEAIVRLLRA